MRFPIPKHNVNAMSTRPASPEDAPSPNPASGRPPRSVARARPAVNLPPLRNSRRSPNVPAPAPLLNSRARHTVDFFPSAPLRGPINQPSFTANPEKEKKERLSLTFADLPDNFVADVLQYIEMPKLDDALTVSKRFPELVNHARVQTVLTLAGRPGRITQEFLPTRMELVDMGIPAANMRGILRTMEPTLTAQADIAGPLQQNTRAHATLQDRQRMTVQYGGIARRITAQTIDIGECNAQQQSHRFAMRVHRIKIGEKYEGAFVNGLMHGLGYRCFANGNSFEGTFVNDQRNGQGTYRWGDGNRCEGAYVNDQLNGQGTSTWAGGSHYEGNFVDGMRNGQGVLTHANGDIYRGAFVNELRNGEGTFTYANGNSFTGTFVNDQPVGPFVMTFSNGTPHGVIQKLVNSSTT